MVEDAYVTRSKIYYHQNKHTNKVCSVNILPQIKLTYPFSGLIIFAYFSCIYDPYMCLSFDIPYIHSVFHKYVMCAIRYYD